MTKGTFFYHFKTKLDLAAALIERYANEDEYHFFDNMAKAEQLARDPLQQLLIFVGLFIESTEKLEDPFPGCLYEGKLSLDQDSRSPLPGKDFSVSRNLDKIGTF